jgi:hypothetical protein
MGLGLGFALGVKGLGGVLSSRFKTSSRVGAFDMATPPAKHPHADLYVRLMTQLKVRIKIIQDTFQLIREGKHYAGPVGAAEFVLLQLRYCCELIAIGCIAVHTDVPRTAKLQKMWNAGRIMEEFKPLKSSYFPLPAKDVVKPGAYPEIVSRPDEHLSKEELLKMYNHFGDLLHAGSFKDHLDKKKRVENINTLIEFTNRIMALLNVHVYLLYEQARLIRVIMQEAKTGRVGWNEFERMEGKPPARE